MLRTLSCNIPVDVFIIRSPVKNRLLSELKYRQNVSLLLVFDKCIWPYVKRSVEESSLIKHNSQYTHIIFVFYEHAI